MKEKDEVSDKSGVERKKNPKTKQCCSVWSKLELTFSLSVQSWMALGMSRAVFSLVMEQMSFRRTISCTNTELFRDVSSGKNDVKI